MSFYKWRAVKEGQRTNADPDVIARLNKEDIKREIRRVIVETGIGFPSGAGTITIITDLSMMAGSHHARQF